MSRRQRIRSSAAMSLFPFLAVLICTMGSLIVLLVLLVQQARVQAAVVPDSEAKQAEDENKRLQKLKMEQEEQQWRQQVLEKHRQAKLKQLDAERNKLSQLEDHLRDLKEEWKQLQKSYAALQATERKQADAELSSQAALIDLQKKIERAKSDLEQAKKEFAGRPKSFAIIPYTGRNGTKRRPIYLECRADVAVIQPEGIQIPLAYLDGPSGAGNPLEAALRAIRDYWVKLGIVDQQTAPYPLIIVRPNSEWTYSRVRQAMRSWEDQFGYELVPDDMQLAYPAADARLARLVQQEVNEAHRRQKILMRMRPKSFGGLSGRGGSRRPGGGRGSFQFGQRSVGSGKTATRGGRVAMGNKGGFGGSSRPQSQRPSQTSQTSQTQRRTATGQTKNNQQGQSQPQGGRQKKFANGKKTRAGSAGSGPTMQSLAKTLGRNWAIPNYRPQSAAFVRKIRVGVLKDKIIILPDKGFSGRPKVYAFRADPRKSIEEFVHSDVWDHVKSWGIASSGGYWKPVLNVKVGPGAENRYRQLKALLHDSGLDIERK